MEKKSVRKLQLDHAVKDIPVADISTAAQNRLLETRCEDEDTLWELRFGTKKWRAWGLLRGPIFYLLWWDPKHTVSGPPPKGRFRRG